LTHEQVSVSTVNVRPIPCSEAIIMFLVGSVWHDCTFTVW
jgi:hypothetical protein